MDSYLRLRALFYVPPALQRQAEAGWVGGELAALRNDVSSLVCIRDVVLMQPCAVLALYENTPKGRCSCRVQSVSGIGGRGGMESCWYFQATNEVWRGIKLLCLSHTGQYHWSTQLLPPAPQPRISHGSCLLTCFPQLAPMGGKVLFPPLFSFFLIWAYFPIWSHPKVVVDGWFFPLSLWLLMNKELQKTNYSK